MIVPKDGLTRPRVEEMIMPRLPLALSTFTLVATAASAPAAFPDPTDPPARRPVPVVWMCRDARGALSRTEASIPALGGGRTDGKVLEALKASYPAARACAHAASRAGTLTFSIESDDQGTVARTCVARSRDLDPTLAACLSDVVAATKLPPGRKVTSAIEPAFIPRPPPEPRPFPRRCAGDPTISIPEPKESKEADKPSPDRPRDGKIGGAENTIRDAKGDIRACYQTALNRNPDLDGRLRFGLGIVASGAVARTCVEGVGLDDAFTSCIVDKLMSLRFPAPSGGAATLNGNFSFVNQNIEGQKWPWGVADQARPSTSAP